MLLFVFFVSRFLISNICSSLFLFMHTWVLREPCKVSLLGSPPDIQRASLRSGSVLRYLTPQLVVLTGWKLLSYYIDSSSTLDKYSKYWERLSSYWELTLKIPSVRYAQFTHHKLVATKEQACIPEWNKLFKITKALPYFASRRQDTYQKHSY